MDLTTSTKRQQLVNSMKTLTPPSPHAPPLPTLPFDLVPNIFSRLPVKLLHQLRCLCKSFNSLISDPKFAKDHLQLSIKRPHLMLTTTDNNLRELLIFDSPMSSVFSINTYTQTQIGYPITPTNGGFVISSCDGILCFAIDKSSAGLWNPSIRKFKLLPPLKSSNKIFPYSMYSFGYDHFINNYKIIGISFCINQKEVSVITMGTNYWRRIQDFPFLGPIYGPGLFMSGTVNWLTYNTSSSYLGAIVSLDLEKESYEKISIPDLKNKGRCTLGVMRECLCIFASYDMFFNVWIMKEYGNEKSWTKLYNVPQMEDHGLCSYTKVLHILEDDRLLMEFYELRSPSKRKLVIYDSKNGTLETPDIQNINYWIDSRVYNESLISPCS